MEQQQADHYIPLHDKAYWLVSNPISANPRNVLIYRAKNEWSWHRKPVQTARGDVFSWQEIKSNPYNFGYRCQISEPATQSHLAFIGSSQCRNYHCSSLFPTQIECVIERSSPHRRRDTFARLKTQGGPKVEKCSWKAQSQIRQLATTDSSSEHGQSDVTADLSHCSVVCMGDLGICRVPWRICGDVWCLERYILYIGKSLSFYLRYLPLFRGMNC
jgi:hypothetical protein